MKRPLLSLFLFICSAGAAQAEIRHAGSLKPIEEELEQSQPDTLVLLDVGGTMIGCCDTVLQANYDEWRNQWFLTHFPQRTKEERNRSSYILKSDMKVWRLLDERWPEVIRNVQSRDLKVLALTKLFVSSSLRGLVADILANFDLPFKEVFPELRSGESFEYGGGIIETGSSLKGPVLKEILSKLPQPPAKIIFVDDRMEQVQSVEAVCCEANIPSVSFHLTAFNTSPPLDEAAADLQLRILATEYRWISEQEALQLLNNR